MLIGKWFIFDCLNIIHFRYQIFSKLKMQNLIFDDDFMIYRYNDPKYFAVKKWLSKKLRAGWKPNVRRE